MITYLYLPRLYLPKTFLLRLSKSGKTKHLNMDLDSRKTNNRKLKLRALHPQSCHQNCTHDLDSLLWLLAFRQCAGHRVRRAEAFSHLGGRERGDGKSRSSKKNHLLMIRIFPWLCKGLKLDKFCGLANVWQQMTGCLLLPTT